MFRYFIIYIAEQELEMKTMAEQLLSFGDHKYNYLLEESSVISPESKAESIKSASPIKSHSPVKNTKNDNAKSPIAVVPIEEHEVSEEIPQSLVKDISLQDKDPVQPTESWHMPQMPKLPEVIQQPSHLEPKTKSPEAFLISSVKSSPIKETKQQIKEIFNDASQLFGTISTDVSSLFDTQRQSTTENKSPKKDTFVSNSGFMI